MVVGAPVGCARPGRPAAPGSLCRGHFSQLPALARSAGGSLRKSRTRTEVQAAAPDTSRPPHAAGRPSCWALTGSPAPRPRGTRQSGCTSRPPPAPRPQLHSAQPPAGPHLPCCSALSRKRPQSGCGGCCPPSPCFPQDPRPPPDSARVVAWCCQERPRGSRAGLTGGSPRRCRGPSSGQPLSSLLRDPNEAPRRAPKPKPGRPGLCLCGRLGWGAYLCCSRHAGAPGEEGESAPWGPCALRRSSAAGVGAKAPACTRSACRSGRRPAWTARMALAPRTLGTGLPSDAAPPRGTLGRAHWGSGLQGEAGAWLLGQDSTALSGSSTSNGISWFPPVEAGLRDVASRRAPWA